jgi:hypothetical protein
MIKQQQVLEGRDEPKDALPGTCYGNGSSLAKENALREGHCTFSVEPQQRPRCFPISEDTAFDEPQRSTFVVSIACDVVIYRWIRGRKPLSKALSYAIPYESD